MTSEPPPTVPEIAVGALIKAAAAVPAVGPPLSAAAEVVWDGVRARRAARTATTLGEIIDGAGGEGALERRLGENPDVETLLVNAVDAAIRSNYEAKRRLLVRAVLTALEDDAKADEAGLLIATLAELEPVHVKALARLAAEIENPPRNSPEWVWGASPTWKQTPAPVRAALIRVGAARSTPTLMHNQPGRGRSVDGITDYGLEVLAMLTDEAAVEPDVG